MKTYIIAGLGNPSDRYTNTRHNAGFKAIDLLGLELGIEVTRAKWDALIGEGRWGEDKLILVKPQTYMNRSGLSIAQVVDFYKAPSSDLLLIHDDIDIDFGTIRFRLQGSAGTHNGMKSVIRELNTSDFPRIRIAVGKRPAAMDLADFVLSNFTKKEAPILQEELDAAVQASLIWLKEGPLEAMNQWNGWKSPSLPKPTAQEAREAKEEKEKCKEQMEFRKNCDYCGKK